MHKSSRKIVELAVTLDVGLIVIRANQGWKQKAHMGNVTNQNFISIPYKTLINMIEYKAGEQIIKIKAS